MFDSAVPRSCEPAPHRVIDARVWPATITTLAPLIPVAGVALSESSNIRKFELDHPTHSWTQRHPRAVVAAGLTLAMASGVAGLALGLGGAL